LIEDTCEKVVPRLLSDGHLGGKEGIKPVVVHGDLWSGNASRGVIGSAPGTEEVIFDSSASYSHSEFELGIMKMFGGFGGAFLREYHQFVPKTEPVKEYDDRVALYECYHHLNHYSMFGGSYRGGAVRILKSLLGKYASEKESRV
jgi:fructosamine-3-kinase